MASFKTEHELEINCIKNPLDPDEFRRQGHLIIDFLADYLKTIEELPVRGHVEPGFLTRVLPTSAPHMPEPIEDILEDIRTHIIPGLVHWQSPNFFAYYPINASTAGIMGDILCSGFNVVPFSWFASPAATELENIVMDWLGELLGLPKSFLFSGGGGGVIHGGTGESIICTLAVAKNRALLNIGQEHINKLVVYCSDQTHCSIRKSAQLSGICANNIRLINTSKKTQFGMCPISLRKSMEADIKAGLVPVYLCPSLGTTSTSAIDPIKELCEVAKEYGVWVHIDAAYAGAACICPEYQHLIDGVESANSFTFNAHKWLLAGLDCCCLWVKDPAALTQALSAEAAYLKNMPSDPKKKEVIDYKDWQICLSRRFRAMRLWVIMRSYGVVNLQKHIRSHMRLAKIFEMLVNEDGRFEIVCKRNFSLVCFRISPDALMRNASRTVNEVNAELLERINRAGRVLMTHTVVGGVYMIRFAVGATLVEERHVRKAWKLVQEHANAILSG